MTEKDNVIKMMVDEEPIYLEEPALLALKIADFAEKNDLTISETIQLFEYQKSIAIGRMIAQGLKVYGEAFDEFLNIAKRIADYIESGKLNARSDLQILGDKKKFEDRLYLHRLVEKDHQTCACDCKNK